MFDIEAQEQDVVEGFVDFVLQSGLIVGRVSASQETQGLHFLVGILQDVDAAKRNYAPEIGRELGWPDFVLLNDAKRATAISLDGINFVTLHRRMENNRPIGIHIAERSGTA